MITRYGILAIISKEKFEKLAKIKAYCVHCKLVFNGVEIASHMGICPSCGNAVWELGKSPKKKN